METLETEVTDVSTSTDPQPQTIPKAAEKQAKTRRKTARPFPNPPRPKTKNGTIDPEKFFPYWYRLPRPEFAEREALYIQREWPVQDFTKGLTPDQREEVRRNPQKLRKYRTKYITKYLTPFETEDWRLEILRRHGSGDYKLFLNDTGITGELPSVTVSKTFLSLRDDEYPPVLDRPELLDLEDPANKSYIESLRMKGIPLPGEEPISTHEEDEMANVAVVEKILEQNQQLTNTVMEQARDRGKQPPAPAPPDPSGVAAGETLKVLSNAAIEGQRIVTDAIKTAQTITAQTNNPAEHTKSVIEMAQIIARPAQGGGDSTVQLLMQMREQDREHSRQMLELQQRMFDSSTKQMEARMALLETQLAQARTAPAANPANGPTVVPGEGQLSRALREALQIKKAFDDLSGGAGSVGGDVPGWVPFAVQGAEMLVKGATNIMHNLAVMRTGQGVPSAPPEINAELPEGQETAQEENDPMKQYLMILREPLLKALNGGNHGYELAGGIIHQFGYGAYGWIQQQGQQGILNMLMQDGALWGEIQRFGNQRVSQFLTEFFDGDQAQRAADGIRAGMARASAPPKPNGAATRTVVQPDGSKVNVGHPGPTVVNAKVDQ